MPPSVLSGGAAQIMGLPETRYCTKLLIQPVMNNLTHCCVKVLVVVVVWQEAQFSPYFVHGRMKQALCTEGSLTHFICFLWFLWSSRV